MSETVKRYYAEQMFVNVRPGASGSSIVVKASDYETLEAEHDALAARVAELEKEVDEVMQQRDRREDEIQAAHLALGGDGEWSSANDLGIAIQEMAEEVMARAESAEREVERLRESMVRASLRVSRTLGCDECKTIPHPQPLEEAVEILNAALAGEEGKKS